MNEFQVVGIISGVSKKSGKAYTMLQLLRDFTENSSQVRQGKECIQQYIEGVCPSDVGIGCIVSFDYTIGSNGYPVVCGVKAI
ncbi:MULTISPECIES: hypothetical protein [Clostridium]|nr:MULTISPECIES: hypothetical protein [Clostridium]MDM8131989.1 hypothetical protein [Clostridium butyricum]MDM8230629.1 hypothetical protein [Clostridium butyricum]